LKSEGERDFANILYRPTTLTVPDSFLSFSGHKKVSNGRKRMKERSETVRNAWEISSRDAIRFKIARNTVNFRLTDSYLYWTYQILKGIKKKFLNNSLSSNPQHDSWWSWAKNVRGILSVFSKLISPSLSFISTTFTTAKCNST
jgi:hypothetical protein